MARPALLSQKILEGKVSLFKRPTSPLWQIRYRIGKTTLRQSTGTSNEAEAKLKAFDLYMTSFILYKEGHQIVTKTFKSVAEAAIKIMETANENGSGKATYNTYIQYLKNWLIPFFGNKAISSVDGAALNDCLRHIELVLKKPPSYSMVNTQISAMNRVFDLAVEKNYLSRSQVPEMKNTGVEGQRRPSFEIYEWVKLYQFMRQWVKQAPKGIKTTRRVLLREYIHFITNTGCRPGTETDDLRWKHVRYHVDKGVQYVEIYVDGKTDPRWLIARHRIRACLKRLIKINPRLTGKTLDEVIDLHSEELIFATPEGKEVNDFGELFKGMLKKAGLLVDPISNLNRTLYSFRHFYITLALLKGEPVWNVASNCGTSVEMIKDHYSHITNAMIAKGLAGPSR